MSCWIVDIQSETASFGKEDRGIFFDSGLILTEEFIESDTAAPPALIGRKATIISQIIRYVDLRNSCAFMSVLLSCLISRSVFGILCYVCGCRFYWNSTIRQGTYEVQRTGKNDITVIF
jgi:hypothetical protein